MQQLTFSKANAKLRRLQNVESLAPYLENSRRVYTLDLLSGWTCPGANECWTRVVMTAGKRSIQEKDTTTYRCFSASQEAAFTSVYEMRQRNFTVLRSLTQVEMIDRISTDLPPRAGIVRIHVSGDFFNANYFRAWADVARLHSDIIFYAYTKSLRYWVAQPHLPENLILTASYGGRDDALIRSKRLRFARVIMQPGQAGRLEIDHDDRHAADPALRRRSFALLIHGVQPAGSTSAAAVKKLNGLGSYTR